MGHIVLTGSAWGSSPTYGELMYQYRMSKMGWDNRTAKENIKLKR